MQCFSHPAKLQALRKAPQITHLVKLQMQDRKGEEGVRDSTYALKLE